MPQMPEKFEMSLQRNINVLITKGDNYYVAECLDISVVTQGTTLDDTIDNLKEAIALHLEDENLEGLEFVSNPSILAVIELKPAL